MFQLIAYKGTAKGWAPIGRPRPFADACRLMRAANAINGDVWSYRLQAVSPELPRFRCADQPLRYVISEPTTHHTAP